MDFSKNASVRFPRMAGRFYPMNRNELQKTVEDMLAESRNLDISGEVAAAMAPHAGYNYSGRIAAPAYRALAAADFDTLVIIGHDFGASVGNILGIMPDYDAYETPLGIVPVDTELAKALTENDARFIFMNTVHDRDQTIEVHLPFLQVLGMNCRILPMFFGQASEKNCREVVRALRKFGGGRRIGILASTDLSHYPTDEDARRLDEKTLNFIRKHDLDGLCRWQQTREPNVDNLEISICSAGGVGVAMLWAEEQGAKEVQILKTGNSSDCDGGDRSRVVGYASLAFVKAAGKNPGGDKAEFDLSDKVREMLLKKACRKIADECGAGGDPEAAREKNPPPELQQPAAVFVTLHRQGHLRGCIGLTQAIMSMEQAVEYCAHAAAFEDPRFQPMTEKELSGLEIEISVLSPLKTVADAAEIIPGKHGVMVSLRGRQGLFLPQVWEQLPDKTEFLRRLCQEKAGLFPDDWKDPACTIQVFTVLAFSRPAAELM